MAMLSHNPNILYAIIVVVASWLFLFQPLTKMFPEATLLLLGLWLIFSLAAFLFFLRRIWSRK